MTSSKTEKPKWWIERYIRSNIWTLLTIIVIVFMLVIIGRNFIHAGKIRYEIGVLESERELYQERITRDSTTIEQLKSDAGLERYAREKYFMQRKNEDIFILEGE